MQDSRKTVRVFFEITALALVLPLGLIFGAAAVQAHAHLRQSTPGAGAVIATSPTEIRLAFTEGVEPKFSGLVLTAATVFPSGSPGARAFRTVRGPAHGDWL